MSLSSRAVSGLVWKQRLHQADGHGGCSACVVTSCAQEQNRALVCAFVLLMYLFTN